MRSLAISAPPSFPRPSAPTPRFELALDVVIGLLNLTGGFRRHGDSAVRLPKPSSIWLMIIRAAEGVGASLVRPSVADDLSWAAAGGTSTYTY